MITRTDALLDVPSTSRDQFSQTSGTIGACRYKLPPFKNKNIILFLTLISDYLPGYIARNMVPHTKSSGVKELHKDLARKYQLHRAKIEPLWRSFGKGLRVKALRAGAAEGVVLKHPRDLTLGNVYKIMPEWNLRDVTEPDSDFLLQLLEHRATKSLLEQYSQGVNGGLGDAEVIRNSMNVRNLRHVETFPNSFTMFIDEAQYGQSYTASDSAKYKETMAGLASAVDAGLCVPQETGELILERQNYLLLALNTMVEDILDLGSTTRSKDPRPKKPDDSARAALSKLSITPKSDSLSLQDLLASALDQKTSLDEYLSLCRTESVFLAYAVNIWFFSRHELVPDEKGRIMPVINDKYISIAIWEMFHNAFTAVATWDYLLQLLQLLEESSKDKVSRGTVLQELSNVLHSEHGRVKKLFKRHVQNRSGQKCFKRVSGVYDSGVARVTMKGKPEVLLREKPQLSYMLRLCAPETDASSTVMWIKKIDDLHQSHRTERDDMQAEELETFGDLAVITGFIQSVAATLPLPSINLRKGQIYALRSKTLASELDPLKPQVDLSSFAVPIDNLLEPGMTEGMLHALDQFLTDNTGTKMGFLYQGLVEACVSEIQGYCQEQKAKGKQKAETLPSLPPVPDHPSVEKRVEERKQREKTRPAHSSIYNITPPETTQPQTKATEEAAPVFQVKQSTFDVFSTLFAKSEARGSVSWIGFEAAMADLSFSIMPKFGSVFTFFPPEAMGIKKSCTLHRPHRSQIEGHVLLRFANRLRTVYGWGEGSFEVV